MTEREALEVLSDFKLRVLRAKTLNTVFEYDTDTIVSAIDLAQDALKYTVYSIGDDGK